MFRLAHCRTRYFVRLGARHRMTGRRPGLADAVKNRTRQLSFRFWWRTPSNHNSASTQIFGISLDAIPVKIELSNFIAKMSGASWPKPPRAESLMAAFL